MKVKEHQPGKASFFFCILFSIEFGYCLYKIYILLLLLVILYSIYEVYINTLDAKENEIN